MHQLDAGEGGLICLERFEAHHRPTQPNPVALRPILLTLQRHLIFSHVLSFICPFHHAHTVLDQDG